MKIAPKTKTSKTLKAETTRLEKQNIRGIIEILNRQNQRLSAVEKALAVRKAAAS